MTEDKTHFETLATEPTGSEAVPPEKKVSEEVASKQKVRTEKTEKSLPDEIQSVSNSLDKPLSNFDFAPFLAGLTQRPGVYRMLAEDDTILYIGKAKNLKKRVSSYFQKKHQSAKTNALVKRIANVDVTITASETEALLLEQQLIKSLKPPYNILLRDDKSYPYLLISTKDDYPRMGFHRGARKKPGKYFGPYPSSTSVRYTLNLMEKAFKLRTCNDSFFSNRSRPCLQYQIKRCTGPCVEAISADAYNKQVHRAMMFLEGKNESVIKELTSAMTNAAAVMEYEEAAELRDQISAVRKIQESQSMTTSQGDADIIGMAVGPTLACFQVLFVRSGRVLGNKAHYIKAPVESDESDLLESFISQLYLGNAVQRDFPKEIILPMHLESTAAIVEAIDQLANKKVQVVHNVRGDKVAWLKMAATNAEHALKAYLSDQTKTFARFEALQKILNSSEMPERMECFDISHTQGECTVASCVVFDQNGPLKSAYKRFNIKTTDIGDDYAAMHEVLSRRYKKGKDDTSLPDIVVIDGGKGQLTQAQKVFQELQLNDVTLLAVSKGPGRKAGLELLHIDGVDDVIDLSADDAALQLIQHIRDESHRFAIAGHRAQRNKKRRTSVLEGIPGVGPKKRRALLLHFGGLQALQQASVHDIKRAEGMSAALAEKVYGYLHD